MKRKLMAAMFAVALVGVVGVFYVWATTPTRTTTRNAVYGQNDWLNRVRLFEYTWTITAKASGDTLILGPFDYRHVGYNDTKISVMMEPQSATVDSVHWKVDYQISTDLEPSTAVGNTTDWKLVETETVAFDSSAFRAQYILTRQHDNFNPRTYGNPAWVRIRVVGTGKTGLGTLVFKGAVPNDVQYRSKF